MRKLFWGIILFLIIIPSTKALQPNYKVTNLSINADIKENGDAYIEEHIALKGAFNGYIRDLYYQGDYSLYDASSLQLLDICEIDIINIDQFDNVDSDCFTRVNQGQNGESYVYEETNTINYKSLKMYKYNPSGTAVFSIRYILKDVVVIHNDIAEFYWTFIGTEFDDQIDEVKININLPAASNELRAWAHGPLNGEIDLIGKDKVIAKLDKLPANNLIDVRMVFDREIVPLGTKLSHQNSFDEIIEGEQKRADDVNKLRQKAKIIHYGIITINYLWLIGLIIIFIHVYKKYDKERKSTFHLEYYREFPGDYGPETLEYLLKQNITNNGLSASILNIIQKKGLKVKEGKKKKDYILVKTKEKDNLTDEEEYLRDWLVKDYGDGKSVRLKDITKASKKNSTAQAFLDGYEKWFYMAKTKAVGEKFYEDQLHIKLKMGLYILIGIVLFSINLSYNIESWTKYVVIIFSIIFLIYIFSFTKRTKKGNDHFVKWKAFKKFLLDFGRFQEKELPEIVLWEKYLVYATIFGIADKVRKTMEIKLKSMDVATTNYPIFTHMYINHVFAHSLSRTINTTRQMSHSKIAQTRMSSGGGFGGGFSGGGGFGGGGTGGGGRGF